MVWECFSAPPQIPALIPRASASARVPEPITITAALALRRGR